MRAAVLAASLLLAGCGYQLANGASDPLGPFTVIGAEVRVPYATAIAAAEEGARAELSRAGLLGGQGSRVVIAVTRVEEASEGIALAPGAPGATDRPLARGIRITVVGRAYVQGSGSPPARDTGEVRASEVFSRPGDAATATVAREEALGRAARRLGERLGRQILGEVDPGEP